ncbi:MAG: hypothetical protein ACTHOR_01750 [Devosia sp.]
MTIIPFPSPFAAVFTPRPDELVPVSRGVHLKPVRVNADGVWEYEPRLLYRDERGQLAEAPVETINPKE